MATLRRTAAAIGGLSLVVGGLAATIAPASANPDGTDLVISEVYGGGGNSGATYTHDFIELYNPTDAPISVDNWSVQYRSATGTTPTVTTLCGEVPAGGHYLVQEAPGAGGTTPLPAPDAFGDAAMSGSNGVVLLVDSATPVTAQGNLAGSDLVVDAVGYGTTPTTFETVNTGVALTNTTAAGRDAAGTDNDHNANDFSEAAPVPQNDGVDEVAECGDTGGEFEGTIAEIQGTGDVSPHLDDAATTQGVVTAAYPSGGFFGFYLQTDGTGGETDLATHNASDGIFVRQTVSAGAVTVQPGDLVEVTGTVTEFAGQTQIEVSDAADIVELTGSPAGVTPVVSEWPDTDAERETLEGMLFAPQGEFTITDNFGTNSFGELVLAQGDQPLIQPTEVARPGSAEADAVAADNAARRIVLDDGSSTSFSSNTNATPPYISNTQPFRVGATSTFDDAVIFTQGGSPTSPTYRFEPVQPVIGPANVESPIFFPDTRTDAPDEELLSEDGTPELKVASFNVLNYFTTLGDPNNDNVSEDGCRAFNDRTGDGNNVRDSCDQRGAWDPEDFERQQTKIVSAINALDADIVGLMEIENSAKLGETPDEAVQSLVDALNTAAGTGTWAANPSSGELPPVEQQDVITNAIIYRTAAVERVGEARALGDLSEGNDTPDDEPFANAREPIAQAFAPVDGGDPFLVVVNHFKSKGSPGPFPGDEDTGDGQGASNESRKRQAQALADWVPTIQGDVEDVLLLGDFNSYTEEDPLHILYDAGYTDVESAFVNGEYSYSFGAQSGSLDHVLANESALERLTGTDIWNINAVEPVALEYSRYNNHGTLFHADGPFRSSDHDPVVVGLDVPEPLPTPVMDVSMSPKKVKAGKTRPTLTVTLVDPENKKQRVDGVVRITFEDEVRTETLRKGEALFELGTFDNAGEVTITIEYLGSDIHRRVTETFTFEVS
jgi:5'-nucleotidase